MAISGDPQEPHDDPSYSLEDDGLISKATRLAQNHGGGVTVNITDIGRQYHNINPQDEVTVVVHEEGIFIQPAE